VQERLFEEGSEVKQGQVLFIIDPAPYEVALENAKALLARAEANYDAAQAQAKRYESLVAGNAVSRQTYEDAVSMALAYKADIAAGKAALRGAEINLEYTRVSSPISGRIGRAEVTEGAYVRMASATLLATVQQLDSLYVDLSQSVEDVLKLKESLSSGRLHQTKEGAAVFTVLLGDGSEYPEPGSLEFSDVSVNSSTGTVTLRGRVPNPNLDLLPGMFVRARLQEGTDTDAILVPQSLVSRNTKGEPTLFLVGENNTVALRVIQTTRAVGSNWLLSGGLEPGEKVIINNRQKIRPGQVINPVPATDAESQQL
jgi:membrane fusion protein, multidrug efflux system